MADKKFWDGSKRYLCDRELAQSFHIARTLGMPLLIEGEPGTGKTELPLQYAADQKLDLFVYPTGSKSNVEQFVARFDHVKYLRDSQIEILNAQRSEKGLKSTLSTGGRDPESLADYVVKGPAANAYSTPNSVLSHRRFVMPESGEVIEISENEMPAIVITSNREQELPTAFKGRCIYHYINFPDADMMREIVSKHFPKIEDSIVNTALDVFYHLRRIGLERAPTTRELLNWLKYVKQFSSKEAINKIQGLEGIGTLIKTQTDLEKIQRMVLNNPDDFKNRSGFN